MKPCHLIARALMTATLVGTLNGADVLDTPVPWAGRISGLTFAELVARMRGWSDVGGSGTFELSTPIPDKLAAKELYLIQIPEAPRPTYRELLVSALRDNGQDAQVRRGKDGIEIVYIYTRSFKLLTGTRQSLDRKGRWNLEGIKSELDDKGWIFSEFVTMQFSSERSSLIVKGTTEDLETIAKFLGQK